MGKPRLRVSFSGGRTSAFMSIWLKQNMSEVYDMRFVFANTGWEHPDTLRFVHEVDTRYGLDVAWVEAVPRRHTGKSSGCRVVTYETASRNGEPFEAVVAAYGLPNMTFQLCNRELKRNAMQAYAQSIGWENRSYSTAIGIRADETRRVNPKTAEEEKLIYPLVSMLPTSKDEVLAFFEDFDWDLRIPEHQGNCIGCVKGGAGYWRAIREDFPEQFEAVAQVESLIDNPKAWILRHRSGPLAGQRFPLRELPAGPAVRGEVFPSCGLLCEVAEQEYAA